MFRACARLFFVGLFVALSSVSGGTMEVPQAMVRLPGHVLPALAKSTVVPSKPDSDAQPMTLTIVLRRDDQAGFERYYHGLYDPHSKNFRRFLSQQQIADRFGPSPADYNSVLAYLRANGFTLVRGSTNRLTLTVSGTRAKAERAFAVRIRDYKIGQVTFHANDRDPEFPDTLANKVESIAGLSDLARAKTTWKAIVDAFCSIWADSSANGTCWMSCNELYKGDPASQACKDCIAKEKPALMKKCESEHGVATSSNGTGKDPGSWLAMDGTGQTVGLIEFDNFLPSDVSDYINLFGLQANIANLSKVDVGGGAPIGNGEDEVLLDIDAVMTIAPGAKVVVYDGPLSGAGSSFQALFNAAIDGGSTIISNSWAYCEDQTTLADVQSIDSIFQSAAASNISIFNGAGDSGSTCLDGSANTVSVPADSPNATAVGGSSLTQNPFGIYGSETWWDGTSATPPTGQGGFGVSKFFPAKSYQTPLSGVSSRSVPDVTVNADPGQGVVICQADKGGCPSGLTYGGTSLAAPEWAAFAAILNQAHGQDLGFLNPLVYPLANTDAFHDAASMGSDFAHVGLGTPNLNVMSLALANATVGAVDPAVSEVDIDETDQPPPIAGFPADGSTQINIVVILRDSNGNTVSGKTVTLAANPGSSAVITPSSAITNVANGAAIFKVTDLVAEAPTFTATDTDDGIEVTQKPSLGFVPPPAASASIGAAPGSVVNDGVSQSTISITLTDSLGHPSPAKQILLQQTGGSVITGPTPAITDSNGEIQFKAVDQIPETVTYTATDVTDGNLPVPGSAQVTFTGNPGNGCGNGTPPAAPGFQVTPYATGFLAQTVSYGNVNFGCRGVAGLAFDAAGDLYVSYLPSGDIYKFPPGGGVANSSTLLTTTPLGPSLAGLAFDASGNLYAGRAATTGNFTTGAVYQVDPTNGSILNTVASNLTCPTEIAVDPLTGDLFTDDSCSGAGSDNPALWRISNPSSAPATSVYANLPGTPNATIAFAPSGTMYAWAFNQPPGSGGVPAVVQISGTNGPTPPTISVLPNLQLAALGLLATGQQANGDANTLFLNPYNPTLSQTLGTTGLDLTTTPPSTSVTLVKETGAVVMTFGPDGCIYAAQNDNVYKITDTSGGCNYAAPSPTASLYLSPVSVSPNPAQGSSQTFTASFQYASAPDGTPVVLNVSGANARVLQTKTTGGVASFSYTGTHQGVDTLSATATLNGAAVASNTSVVTWGAGTDVTFLTLNQSPTGATTGQQVNLTANLTDVSLTPTAEISGQQVSFKLGGANCSGTTDSNGNAGCQVTASGTGTMTLSADFAGTLQYNPSSDSKSFNVLAPTPTPAPPTPTPTPTPVPTPTPTPVPTPTPTPVPTPTPTPVPTPTPTPVPTPTPTPVPTPTPTPVPTPTPTPRPTPTPTPKPTPTATPTPSGQGRLLILPPYLKFVTQVGEKSPPLGVKAINVSWTDVRFSGVAVSGDSFALYKNQCQGRLHPRSSCWVTVTFSPKKVGQFDGLLTFTDTAKGSPQTVRLRGTAIKKRDEHHGDHDGDHDDGR